MKAQDTIDQTKAWIESFVIHHNLCPFAKVPFTKDIIEYRICDATDAEAICISLLELLRQMQATPIENLSNAFLIFPEMDNTFEAYLDIFYLAEAMLEDMELDEDFQLVSFHPRYCYADTDANDSSNYTNRSPYPMIHVLHIDEVEEAIEAYGDTNKIIDGNTQTLENLRQANKLP